MLARTEDRRKIRVYFITAAILLTLLVGVSRVLMLVHYPTDVLGGWTAGCAWALVWWLIARRLQHEGKIESEGEQGAPSADGA
jgi:undecaprenyl-diphosphatase